MEIQQPVMALHPSAIDIALRGTKKGGIPGKKRGKYKKDSRVTLWRQRVCVPVISDNNPQKAKEAETANSQEPLSIPAQPPASPQDTSCSATVHSPNFQFPAPHITPESTKVSEELQVSQIVSDLRSMVAQVKNVRSKAGSLTPYDYLRHLSVTRYIEWTYDGIHSGHV